MRARELLLSRAFGRIVSVALLAASGSAGCHASTEESPLDAGDASNTAAPPPPEDATVPPPDAPATDDAGALDAGWGEACAPVPFDGSVLELEPDACATSTFHVLPCGLPPKAQLEGCNVDLATCVSLCQGDFFLYCLLAPTSCTKDGGVVPDAASVVECVNCAGSTGRRPRGLLPASRRGGASRREIGDYFASMAHLESASVRAFRELERSLRALGAPASLARRARHAAEDERRHARATARLARRFGGKPPRPEVARAEAPSLFELLHHNVVEGCVGETFGALVATWQAERAGDARIRATLQRIAADEVRHAVLAWDLHAWGASKVTREEQTKLDAALHEAFASLASRARLRTSSREGRNLERLAGHPSPAEEALLLGELASRIAPTDRAA